MNSKKQASRRSEPGNKASDIGYVIKYVAEDPERECFFQYGQLGGRKTIFSDLNDATVFRSLESASDMAGELDRFDPAGRGSNMVFKLRRNVPGEAVTEEELAEALFRNFKEDKPCRILFS
jgi:hypothetical protein